MKAERGWVFRGVLVGLVAVAMMSGCGGKDDDSTGGSTDAADTGSSTGGATMGAQTTGEDPASSTGTTAEPTGAADGPDCKTVCEVVTAHAGTNKCTNLPPDCEVNCQKVHDLLVPCQSQWVALIDCQIGTTADDWMCDAMGGMTLKDGVCAAEDMAFDACTQG